MDYMKLVADLCQIIDRQNEITKAMAVQLGQRDALRYEEEMAAVRRDYYAKKWLADNGYSPVY